MYYFSAPIPFRKKHFIKFKTQLKFSARFARIWDNKLIILFNQKEYCFSAQIPLKIKELKALLGAYFRMHTKSRDFLNAVQEHVPLQVEQANGELQAIQESPTGRHFCCHSNQIIWVINKGKWHAWSPNCYLSSCEVWNV